MPSISLQGVSKLYKVYASPVDRIKELFSPSGKSHHREFWALKNINLQAETGHTIGLIGRNGSGKSTLLRVLAGTTVPTKGEVDVQGRISSLLDLTAGFKPDFSGLENAYLQGALMGLSNQQIHSLVDKIADFSDLGDYLSQPVKTYSSGMVIRLGFSIAIHMTFDVLLVDEVLAVGDLQFQRRCLRKIRSLQHQDKTIVLASHNLGDFGAFCDRLVLLKDGEIMMDGKTEDVLQQYMAEMEAHRGRIDDSLSLFSDRGRYGEELGSIRITRVRFLDNLGQERHQYAAGEAMAVEMDYEVLRPIENPLFRVQIFRNDGLWVHGSNTYRMAIDLGTMQPGPGRMKVRYHALNLLDGDYLISVGAWPDEFCSYVSNVSLDHRELAFKISIRSTRDQGGGVALLPCTWEAGDDAPVTLSPSPQEEPLWQRNMVLHQHEMEQGKVVLKANPRLLQLEPTNRCNLVCTMCARPYWDQADHPLGDMSAATLRKTLPLMDTAEEVVIAGYGEPLLAPLFWEALAEAVKRAGSVRMITNGLLMDRPVIERLLASGIAKVHISVDGATDETYRRLRGAELGRVLDNLRTLVRLRQRWGAIGPALVFNFVASLKNIGELSALVDLAAVMGVEAVDVAHQKAYSRSLSDQVLLRHRDVAMEAFARAEDVAKQRGIGLSLPSLEETEQPCQQPFHLLFVRWNGQVRGCCSAIFDKGRFTLAAGDLATKPLREIWNDLPLVNYRRAYFGEQSLPMPCQGCCFRLNVAHAYDRWLDDQRMGAMTEDEP